MRDDHHARLPAASMRVASRASRAAEMPPADQSRCGCARRTVSSPIKRKVRQHDHRLGGLPR